MSILSRTLTVAACLGMIGCAANRKDVVTSSEPGSAIVDNELDYALLNIVLADLDATDVYDVADWERDQRTTIELHHATRWRTPTISEKRIWTGSRGEKIPPDIRKDLMRRNQNSVSLADFTPACANVHVEDLRDVLRSRRYTTWKAFQERYPRSKGFVHTWLPGYSLDGRKAMVRCRIGPARTGARTVASYLLEQRDGQWQVVWRLFSEA